ncbi:MAG TPA: hypothetical protein H9694_09490 [Firmicutes bacterium]|nr:hypothetical protein [Bacillota bacterium]
MKRPLIYVCSRYSEGDSRLEDIRRAGRYCRQLYEAGYAPIAPHIFFPQFLDGSIPEEKQDFRDMSLLFLRRCSALILCDAEPDDGMMDLIQNAQRYHILCTTLDGLLAVQSLIRSSKPEINADK